MLLLSRSMAESYMHERVAAALQGRQDSTQLSETALALTVSSSSYMLNGALTKSK